MDPSKYGLGTPQYGLGTTQYGDYVATSWKNVIFCQNDVFFDNFSFRALKLVANHEKQLLTFFWLFTPLFQRFMLSGVAHGEELFEI